MRGKAGERYEVIETPVKFYAVASNIDKIKRHPDLSMLDWIKMKTKNKFVNMKQVHFIDKQKAIDLYSLIKERNIIVFKNW